jgi:hypothetical protein
MTKLVKGTGRMNPVQLVDFSLKVETNLKDNPNFSNLSPSLEELATKRVALTQANIDAADGGRMARVIRERCRRELKLTLDAVAGDVVSQAGEDPEKILSAGFFVRANSRSFDRLPMPLNLRARISDQVGEARLDWATTRGAAIYVVEHNGVSPDDTSAWTQVLESTRIRCSVAGLTSAKEHWFRVRAVGTVGRSPWSDVARTLVR